MNNNISKLIPRWGTTYVCLSIVQSLRFQRNLKNLSLILEWFFLLLLLVSLVQTTYILSLFFSIVAYYMLLLAIIEIFCTY